MKKLIPIFAVPLLLAGCGNNTSSESDTNSPADMNTNSAVAPADTNMPAVNTNADMIATNAPSATGNTNTPP